MHSRENYVTWLSMTGKQTKTTFFQCMHYFRDKLGRIKAILPKINFQQIKPIQDSNITYPLKILYIDDLFSNLNSKSVNILIQILSFNYNQLVCL